MIDQHEIDQVVNAYLPLFQLEVETTPGEEGDALTLEVRVNGKAYSFCQPRRGDLKRQWKHFSKNAVYRALVEHTGRTLRWGSHTGVRPVSLVHQLEREGTAVARELREEYHFSESKIALVQNIAAVQRPLLNREQRALDVYIGIPFCRSRCSYCSFSLVGIEKKGKLQAPYTNALCREIEEVGRRVIEDGYRIRCLYIGGGTPTALEDAHLQRLLDTVGAVFPERQELTLEAGRPDTITRSNLQMAKAAGVTRLSINPQTKQEKTLERIGRRHTSGEIERAFALAREIGFNNINMDIIAGLPGESEGDFEETVDWVLGLAPESITVHSLALKRSSGLKKQDYAVAGDDTVSRMLDDMYGRLERSAYHPYYLYRQKYMADNGENVGFCLPGKECIYNIDVMEENTHVLAMGSGAVSKRIDGDSLVRRSDPKDVEVFLERIDDTISKNITFFHSFNW